MYRPKLSLYSMPNASSNAEHADSGSQISAIVESINMLIEPYGSRLDGEVFLSRDAM